MPTLRRILISAIAVSSAVLCPVVMTSSAAASGGGGTASPGAPCLQITSFSAQGSNSRGGILEKDVVQNCGTAPITFRYHLTWNTTLGKNGVLNKLVTLPVAGKQTNQRVITGVTPFRTYLVQLALVNPNTGAFYDIKSQFAGLFPRV